MQPKSNHLLVVVGATIVSWILRVSLAGLACLSNPCLNGICIDDINSSFTCFCADGFTGELCGTNWDECWSSPCENGGTCTDSIAAFNCSCPPGFTGERCEWNVDECASSPCLNGGSCIDQENGFLCSCPAGYAGDLCGIDVSVCNISYPMPHIPGPRCYNGGVCLDGPGPSFTCLCIAGWTGSRCEVQVDECSSSPCKNGGLCVDLLADYSCACPFGYTGKNCEMTLQMCRGINGSRINIFGGVETDGIQEENEEDVCENGALCLLESNGARVCYCVPDFHGDRCQYRYDECLLAESSPWLSVNGSSFVSGGHCQNGGECIDGVDSFSCSCPANFTGHLCECPLYMGPDSDVDPHCLITSTYPTKFPSHPSEFIPVTTSTSTLHSISTVTSVFITETQKTTLETTMPEAVTVTTYTKRPTTPETTTMGQPGTEFSTLFKELLHTTTDRDSKVTATGATDVTTYAPDLSSPPFFTSTTLQSVPSMDEPATSTEFSTLETMTYSPDFSTTIVPGVVGEDKIWSSEEMTLPGDVTVAPSTDKATDLLHKTTSMPTTVVTEVPLVPGEPGLSTTMSAPYVTEKTTAGTPPTYMPSVPPSEIPKTEWPPGTSTVSTTLIQEGDTTLPTTAPVSPGIPGVTDSLITYIYTSEKVAVTSQVPFSEGIIPTHAVSTEKPIESTYSESPTDRITAGEVTSTPLEPWGITGKVITDEAPYPTVTTLHKTSEIISVTEELETRKVTSATDESWTPSPADIYPVPGVTTYGPTGFPITSPKFENVTTLDTITSTVLPTTKVITASELPTEDYTSKIDTTSGPSVRTSTETSTYFTTQGLPNETSRTDITSTTYVTSHSEPPTEIGCNVTPCLNGGTCYYNECECTFRFVGEFCETKKTVEVASFNGNSYLMHTLNTSDHSSPVNHGDDLDLDDTKSNFKRHAGKNNSTANPVTNEKSDEVIEHHGVYEEVYDYYGEYDYSHNYSYYDEDEGHGHIEAVEISESGNYSSLPSEIESLERSPSSPTSKNSTVTHNFAMSFQNHSSSNEYYVATTLTSDGALQNGSFVENVVWSDDSSNTVPNNIYGATNSSVNSINSTYVDMPSNSEWHQRKERSLHSHPSVSTSIAVKISLQERSLRVGGWGLVMKITLGSMAKASLSINHKSGLMRFLFTCGLGRSLLFGEEDGQRWAGQGRRQPIQSIVIPVHVVLEVTPYEAIHKSNPSSGRSYIQCVASLKINGQVAVRGQQRAPMPKKSSSGKVDKQSVLFLGGVPNMLLPCNQAIDSSMDEKEKPHKYEESPEHDEDDDEHEGFVGCMQELKINGINKRIFEDALDGNEITECGEATLTGKDLEREDNPCFSLPCYGSSTCEVTENGGWRCRCPTGWLGPSCEQSVCDNNPCLFGATCLHDDVGGFVCLCPLGKGGRMCENDLEVTKPCFDSRNDWDIEDHQPFIAYPLDHNHLSSPQLVFRFKFAPASVSQIGLLAYIGDLNIPKSLQSYHSSFLSEIKESYFETTTNSVTSELPHLTEYPSTVLKDSITEFNSESSSQTTPQSETTSIPPPLLEENPLPVAIVSGDDTDNTFPDFNPPLDIPIFQDDAPPFLKNLSTLESLNLYSTYIFSPFAPYPYYLRQNGKDHMAVSYIRGHLVLTWDLGSGPRRIFTVEPLPMLNDEASSTEQIDSLPVLSVDLSNIPHVIPDHAKFHSINHSPDVLESQMDHKIGNFDLIPPVTVGPANGNNTDEKQKEKSPNFPTRRDLKSVKLNTGDGFVNAKTMTPLKPLPTHYSDLLVPGVKHQGTETDKAPSNNNQPFNSKTSVFDSDALPKIGKDHSEEVLQILDPISGNPVLSQYKTQNDIKANFPTLHEESKSHNSHDHTSAKIVSPPSPNRFHEVTIWREGQQAWLKVGEQVIRGHSPGRHYQLNAHRPFLYLGGHDANNMSSLPHDIPLHSGFSGCIFDAELRFGGRHLVLNKRPIMFTKGRGVGECGLDSCEKVKKEKGDVNPCLNGGTCIPRGPTFVCICQSSWFGPLCANTGHNPCDEGMHSCRSGSTCVTLALGGYRCDCLPGTHGIYCEKDSPIGWSVKFTGHRSFLGVRVPFRGWKKRPSVGSPPDKPKREAFCIDLEIKPNKPNSGGLILFVMGSHLDEYLSLCINKKGEPELRIGPGSSRMSGPLVISYNDKLQRESIHQEVDRPKVRSRKNDGRIHSSGWRKIRIFRRGQRVFLAMDGLLHGAGTLDAPSQNLPSIQPYNNSIGSSLPLIYLGGLPDLAILPQNAIGDARLARPFVGCVRNVAVDWQRVPLGEGAGSYGRNAYTC